MEDVTTQDLLLVIGEQTVVIRVLKQDLKDANDKAEALLSDNIQLRNQLEAQEGAGQ